MYKVFSQRLFIYTGLISLLLIVGCKNSDAKSEHQQAVAAISMVQDSTATEEEEIAFPPPAIPLTIQNAHERALYYVQHFWDNCDFDQHKLLQSPKKLEQSLVNLLGVALYFPVDKVQKSLIYPLERSQDSLFLFFKNQYERYLYEPQSPFFNEEYYLPIVEWLAETPKIDLTTQEKTKYFARLMKRNRVGYLAEDFQFLTSDSVSYTLSNFRGKATILMFYSPGCHSCQEVIAKMKENIELRQLIQSKKSNLLFINAEDNWDVWRGSIEELPSFGIAGFNSDGKVTEVPLYDLKYSPTLYLLDQEGKVVLKDTTFEHIMERIKEL
ncbi:DUF5106 domain-containing protein [Porphyromonas gingivicanis]|uniref:DUF5106 domain-containing protein n=1 Tax=Porphyromonas gingivicanis TaxID=266762 RepID=UPI00046EB570|nr:DUF5106 domain-containing protein [Porphyromonas gingivicanis]